jgi:hypothetical protein
LLKAAGQIPDKKIGSGALIEALVGDQNPHGGSVMLLSPRLARFGRREL